MKQQLDLDNLQDEEIIEKHLEKEINNLYHQCCFDREINSEDEIERTQIRGMNKDSH
jgi:hypothetical protein